MGFIDWELRLRALLRHRRAERELQEEFEFHRILAVHTGAPPATFAGEDAALEACRDVRGLRWLEDAGRDLRLACRRLRRAPGFTAVALLILTLGLGSEVTMVAVIHGVLLQPLALRQPDRLVYIQQTLPQYAQQYPTIPVNQASFDLWRKDAKALAGLALVDPDTADLTGAGPPQQVTVYSVSPRIFSVLGVPFRLGRGFMPKEGQAGRNHVLVLTDRYWHGPLHADPAVLGKVLDLNGVPNQVVGVLPAQFEFPSGSALGPAAGHLQQAPDMFRPLVEVAGAPVLGNFEYGVIARLRPGATIEQVRGELNGLTAGMLASAHLPVKLQTVVTSLRDQIVGPSRRGLWLLLAAVTAVLFIVCFNLAGLLLARAQSRRHERAIRRALGASRRRLVQSAAFEVLLLALSGAAWGSLAAFAAIRAAAVAAPRAIPRLTAISVNGGVLTAAFLLAIGCAGGMLVWIILPESARAPQAGLRQCERALAGRSQLSWRNALTAGQCALTAALLAVAGLLAVSYARLMSVPAGFQTAGRISAVVEWNAGTVSQRRDFFLSAAARLRALPGVSAVGIINSLPLTGSGDIDAISFVHDRRPATQRPVAERRYVDGAYFAAAGIPLLRGHVFTDAELQRSARNSSEIPCVVSVATAARVWPGRDSIGQRFIWNQDESRVCTVIGVVGDVRNDRLDMPPALAAYVPVTAYVPLQAALILRGQGTMVSAAAVRQAIWSLQPSATIPKIETLRAVAAASTAGRRFQLWIVLFFALSALLLATLGIYGVVSQAVTRRTRELGLRLALGATRRELFLMVLRQGLAPVAAGVVAGLIAALVLGRLLASFLFGIAASNPWILAGVAASMLAVASVACALPARRATHADPVMALRAE